MNQEQRTLLEKPFDPGQIKQRQGNFGKVLDYIEGHAVIQRLNDCFDGNWSFEIQRHEVMKDEVLVLGRLAAEGVVKTQFGSSMITRAKGTGEIVSMADDLKAAGTDSLKKCATMLGIGLHLYGGRNGDCRQPRQQPKETRGNGPHHIREVLKRSPLVEGKEDGAHGNGGKNGGNGKNGNGRITSKQHTYLKSLAVHKGMTLPDLENACQERFGATLAYIRSQEASSLISEFMSR